MRHVNLKHAKYPFSLVHALIDKCDVSLVIMYKRKYGMMKALRSLRYITGIRKFTYKRKRSYYGTWYFNERSDTQKKNWS